MDDTTTEVLITLSVNLVYQLIHYLIRKLTDFDNISFPCIRLNRTVQTNLKKFSSSSDKDAIPEIKI